MAGFFADPERLQLKRRHCMLGQTDLRINPQGTVYFCDVRNTAIGTVDEAPLRTIWRGEDAHRTRRAIRLCRRPCSSLCHRSHTMRDKVKLFARYARDGRL